MSILSDEAKIKTAVGLLRMRADELTKRVLTPHCLRSISKTLCQQKGLT